MLLDKKLKVSVSVPVRTRIWRAFLNHNEITWETNDWGSSETSIIGILPEKIEAELGLKELMSFPEHGDGPPKSGKLEDFVMRGSYPPYLFETIEIFYQNLEKNQNSFQTCINDIMEESNLPWRMANGKIFPIDSSYIQEEIVKRAYELIHEASFHGALVEFEKARTDLVGGDYEGAIQNSNLAVESVIKEILGVQKAKPGELFSNLRNSGLIPEYHNGFLDAFEKHIIRCVAVMRNQEPGVGHGRGQIKNSIPPELAEMGVNFSAVLINYLIKRHLSDDLKKENASADAVDDIPF